MTSDTVWLHVRNSDGCTFTILSSYLYVLNADMFCYIQHDTQQRRDVAADSMYIIHSRYRANSAVRQLAEQESSNSNLIIIITTIYFYFRIMFYLYISIFFSFSLYICIGYLKMYYFLFARSKLFRLITSAEVMRPMMWYDKYVAMKCQRLSSPRSCILHNWVWLWASWPRQEPSCLN